MRKILVTLLSTVAMMGIASLAFAADGAPVKLDSASLAVSYTHLTLPTILLV